MGAAFGPKVAAAPLEMPSPDVDNDAPEIILVSEDGKQVFIGASGLEIVGNPDLKVNGWFKRVDNGNRCHYKDGKIHHDSEPAFILANDRGHVWYKEGKIHREIGLAVDLITEWGAKRQCSYRNGLLHADGKPASHVVETDGTEYIGYYQNGLLHRTDGPAYIIKKDGEAFEQYLINNLLHREDGPALVSKSARSWYQEGELHRLDGPAIIKTTGEERYYIQGLETDKKAVSKAFLENRGQKIGQAKKTDIIEGDAEDKKRAMLENIERWKREKDGVKPSAKLPSKGMR